jgi:hypothetical protein
VAQILTQKRDMMMVRHNQSQSSLLSLMWRTKVIFPLDFQQAGHIVDTVSPVHMGVCYGFSHVMQDLNKYLVCQ